MKSNFYVYSCLILLILNIPSSHSFKCGADKMNHIKITKVSSSVKNKENRKLSTEFQPIQIKYDYTYLDSQSKDASMVSKIKNLLEQTSTYFQKILSVKHDIFDFDSVRQEVKKNCLIPKMSDDAINWSNKYDLVILPYFEDKIEKTIQAAASPCIVDNNNFSKIGIMMLNPHLEYNKQNYEKYFLSLFLHEISHIMIYHSAFFEAFDLYDSKIENNQLIYYINSPKVLEKAKLHYGCNTLDGIPLENQGGEGTAGSHWEARYMLGDYMISIDYPEIVISDISLALFEDSGIYKVNYYTGGLFRFGKGEGCEFFKTKCIVNEVTPFLNEFCSDSKPKCTNSHLSKGDCFKVKFYNAINENYRYFKDKYIGGFEMADYCPVSYDHRAHSDNTYNNYYFPLNCAYGVLDKSTYYNQQISENSLCFESSLISNANSDKIQKNYQSICYKVACDKINKNLIVYIGDSKVTCLKEGGKIENPNGYVGVINCPDYNLVCTSDIWCNDMFDCIDKSAIADESSYIYDYDLPFEDGLEEDFNSSQILNCTLYLLISLFIILL